MNCPAPYPGDMDFCLYCSRFYECIKEDNELSEMALLETDTLSD